MPHPETWLIRHGETEWSAAGRHTGHTDLDLSDVGRAAAGRLGSALAGVGFETVFTSPMRRARETCERAGLGGQSQVLDDLREWDYGDYEGLTTPEIRTRCPGWTLWADGCPRGEIADQVGARVDRVISQLRGIDGPAAVFGHGHCLRVLAARWAGLDPRAGAVLALDTATVSRLGWEREQPVIRQWNLTP